jgi:2,4-dienoyl-CoA reductase-like NADH-dependent reductase (Old Yellow Enzyme family)
MTRARLVDPLRLACGVTLPNRLLKSAMTEGLADVNDQPTAAHEALYGTWSQGGTGTLITGNVMVDRRYLERPGNVVVEDESVLPALQRWAAAGTAGGNQLWMQISHPGRQCSRMVTKQPVAPSAVQLHLGGMFAAPRPLTEDEIPDIIARYARTAALAKQGGFTGVQVHGAHGYLCSQFLSPRTNQRTDHWGGSLDNRARFLREIVRAVRSAVGPAYPVAVKLNSSDFQRGGFGAEESQKVAAWLVEDGIDLLEISGGTYEQLSLFGIDSPDEPMKAQATRAREAYFLEYASAMRESARVPLAVTGGFRTPTAMHAALAAGLLDVIGLARPLCVEPALSARLLAGSHDTARTDEHGLRLAGGVLGPSSAIKTLRALNAQAQTAWYYAQLLQLAAAKPPALKLSAMSALVQHYRREYQLATARRHAARSQAAH